MPKKKAIVMPKSQNPQTRDLSDSSDNHPKILPTLSASLVWFATVTTLFFIASTWS